MWLSVSLTRAELRTERQEFQHENCIYLDFFGLLSLSFTQQRSIGWMHVKGRVSYLIVLYLSSICQVYVCKMNRRRSNSIAVI